jgi:succinate dehydrogenase / fumarate reductase iron-sulfur subunit
LLIEAHLIEFNTGGFISVNTGNPVDANAIQQQKDADSAFDAATCIGCGACVATCKNSSAMLFVAAKYPSTLCTSR